MWLPLISLHIVAERDTHVVFHFHVTKNEEQLLRITGSVRVILSSGEFALQMQVTGLGVSPALLAPQKHKIKYMFIILSLS